MKSVLKSLGALILLGGVVVMLIPTLTDTRDNQTLTIGLGLIVGGFLLHIFLNRKIV